MQREKKYITKVGSYTFGDNYELIFRNKNIWLNDCNIICENNCLIDCGYKCNIICGNDCIVDCGNDCKVDCGNNCEINCAYDCYIKAAEDTKLQLHRNLLKTISKSEEFIWWYFDYSYNLINTYEDKDWQRNNPDKFKELYPFLHNELDSATLF